MQLHESLIKRYRKLFELGEGEPGYPLEEGEVRNEKQAESFRSRWGWFITLDNISNNDRTKWDYFLEMNVIEFLNTLAYYKEKGIWQAEQIKAIKTNGGR